MDVFVRRFDEVAVTAEEIIRLDRLGPQLRLEIQYVLQCRHHQRATKTLPAVVMAVVRALAGAGAVSLLDRTEDDWRTGIGRPAPRDSNLRALLIDARRKVCDLADGDGWEAEFDRDVWQMRRLGFTGNQQLDFTAIVQRWLRGLVKRWMRWRLGTGLGLEAARPPRAPLYDPVRAVLPAHRCRRTRRHRPGRAGALHTRRTVFHVIPQIAAAPR